MSSLCTASYYKRLSNSESNSALKSLSKYLCSNNWSTLFLSSPSITRHYLKKSSSTKLIPGKIPPKLTSCISRVWEICSIAVGICLPTKVEFILKATLCFLVNSCGGIPLSLSPAPIVSNTSYKVCRSESPGKRGKPEEISAKIQPTAHTSILSL